MDLPNEQVTRLFTAFLIVNIAALISGFIVVYLVGVLEGLLTTVIVLLLLPGVINYRLLKN